MATSAHAAFEKACQYFAMELSKVPVGADGRADVAAMVDAVDDDTVAMVGSAPCFPTGLIDPIDPSSPLRLPSGASDSTPTPAWAGSCCRGPSGWGTRCHRSTSVSPA